MSQYYEAQVRPTEVRREQVKEPQIKGEEVKDPSTKPEETIPVGLWLTSKGVEFAYVAINSAYDAIEERWDRPNNILREKLEEYDETLEMIRSHDDVRLDELYFKAHPESDGRREFEDWKGSRRTAMEEHRTSLSLESSSNPENQPTGLTDKKAALLAVFGGLSSLGAAASTAVSGVENRRLRNEMAELRRELAPSTRVLAEMMQTRSGTTIESNQMQIANWGIWFTNMMRSHQLLVYRQRLNPRIKVAILDTGCGLHDGDEFEVDHIKAVKNFLGSNFSWVPGVGTGISDSDAQYGDKETEDKDGHGTHLLSLLFQVAPFVNFYVGKCLEKKGQTMAAEKLAFAINFAVAEWKVDVINLAIGYDNHEPEVVRKAIDNAVEKGVLVFAAAGNTAQGPTAFPASMERVIPIYSCGSEGPSTFNPRPITTDYFCAPGEGVRGLLAEHVRANMSRSHARTMDAAGCHIPMTGTSQATAIACAVAACVLEFARAYKKSKQDMQRCGTSTDDWPPLDSDDNMRALKTPHGMKRVLKLLSTTKSGPMCIEPWHVMYVPEHDEDADRARKRFADRLVEVLHA